MHPSKPALNWLQKYCTGNLSAYQLCFNKESPIAYHASLFIREGMHTAYHSLITGS